MISSEAPLLYTSAVSMRLPRPRRSPRGWRARSSRRSPRRMSWFPERTSRRLHRSFRGCDSGSGCPYRLNGSIGESTPGVLLAVSEHASSSLDRRQRVVFGELASDRHARETSATSSALDRDMTVSAAEMMKRSKPEVQLEGLEYGLRAVAAIDVTPEVPLAQGRVRVEVGKRCIAFLVHHVGETQRNDLQRRIPAHQLDGQQLSGARGVSCRLSGTGRSDCPLTRVGGSPGSPLASQGPSTGVPLLDRPPSVGRRVQCPHGRSPEFDLAGVRHMTVHDARRTCATVLVDLEVHPRVDMGIRRHTGASMTWQIYGNARADGDKRRASQAEGSPSTRRSILVFVAVLAVFCCCTRTQRRPHQFWKGHLTCTNVVGVTGFEPAASSSRTTSKDVANGR